MRCNFCSLKQKCKNKLIEVETSNPRLNFIKWLLFFLKLAPFKIFKSENVKIKTSVIKDVLENVIIAGNLTMIFEINNKYFF